MMENHSTGTTESFRPPRDPALPVAALVSGILGMIACVPLGPLAILLGLIALSRLRNRPAPQGAKVMAWIGLACGFISVTIVGPLVGLWFWHGLDRTRRIQCRSHMQALGTALLVYSAEHGADAVPEISRLIELGLLDAEQSFCPSRRGKPSNYVILSSGGGLPDDVLAFEPESNHLGEGGHVLHADGRIEFLPPSALRAATTRTADARRK